MLRIYETDCAALAPYWDKALALLPPEIEVGSKVKCEYFQYEIIG